MLYYERKLKSKGYDLIIGVDEAGRGPLAGPVVAAALVLENSSFKNRIDDSKKLSPFARQRAFGEIIRKSVYSVAIVDEQAIDRLNILQASRLAMKEAVLALVKKLKSHRSKRIYVIIDGDIKLDLKFPCQGIIRGDAKSKTIASASILAKVTRDTIMDLYDRIYPQYKFSKHKGYPTREHRAILKRIGPCLIHRRSFSYGS